MTATTTKKGESVPRPRADAVRNRAKVLEAARGQFAEHGLDAQIDEIAREAGVGVGTVYRHFPTKEDLLEALADERFESLAQAAREALDVENPWDAFAGFMTFSARVMAEDRALSEAIDQRRECCSSAAARVDLGSLTERLVERAKASGELRDDIVAADIPSLVCGLSRAVRANEGQPSMSWERYLEIILAGLHV